MVGGRVLSLPFALRTRLAFDQALCSEVLRIFMRSVFASLRRRARRTLAATRLYCGSVCFLQRAGGAINLNPHSHALVLDGVYVSTVPYEPPRFTPLSPPSNEEVARITARIARRVERLLVKKGLLAEHAATVHRTTRPCSQRGLSHAEESVSPQGGLEARDLLTIL
jgi:hypothetical protein